MSRIQQLRFVITLPQGHPDLGAEIDVQVTVNYVPAQRQRHRPLDRLIPAWHHLVSAVPVCGPFTGVYADLEQAGLEYDVNNWLDSDEGTVTMVGESLRPALRSTHRVTG